MTEVFSVQPINMHFCPWPTKTHEYLGASGAIPFSAPFVRYHTRCQTAKMVFGLMEANTYGFDSHTSRTHRMIYCPKESRCLTHYQVNDERNPRSGDRV